MLAYSPAQPVVHRETDTLPILVPLHNVGIFHDNRLDVRGVRERVAKHGGRENIHYLPHAHGL